MFVATAVRQVQQRRRVLSSMSACRLAATCLLLSITLHGWSCMSCHVSFAAEAEGVLCAQGSCVFLQYP